MARDGKTSLFEEMWPAIVSIVVVGGVTLLVVQLARIAGC